MTKLLILHPLDLIKYVGKLTPLEKVHCGSANYLTNIEPNPGLPLVLKFLFVSLTVLKNVCPAILERFD